MWGNIQSTVIFSTVQVEIFRTFATLSAHYGFDSLIVGMSHWAGHYILKGVTDALFLDIRTTTIES